MNILKISAVSATKNPDEYISAFQGRLNNVLQSLQKDTKMVVFPEYCWGNATTEQIKEVIDNIRADYAFNFIFGSHGFDLGTGKVTNNALIAINDKNLIFSSKTLPMQGERIRQNINSGHNLGIVNVENRNFGVLICADLWNWKLIHHLVNDQKAEILVIPAFTVVPPGMHFYARYQWLSLAITRSREFVIPIVIADHNKNTDEYDVGAVTAAIDPSVKHDKINSMEDFICLAQNNVVNYDFDFDKIDEYREYRMKNGLLQ